MGIPAPIGKLAAQVLVLSSILLSVNVLSRCATPLGPSRDRTLLELHHTSWTAKDGVPGEVLALAQTNDGYLWLGTANGLCRFDGVRFELYQPPHGQRFPAHIVESLLATPDGGLWIGFRYGGASFLKDGKLTIYGEAEGMPPGTIRAFSRTHDGAMWAAGSAGLLRFSGSRWQAIGADWDYPWARAQTVFTDRAGTLWVAGDDSIVFLPAGQTRFRRTAERVIGRRLEVNCILQAPDGRIWFGETTHSVRPVTLVDEKNATPPPEIVAGAYGLLFDDTGSLWIASLGDGVGRVRYPDELRGTQKFASAAEVFSQAQGLSSNYVTPVLEDREGNIWVGTSLGLDRFQQTSFVPAAIPAGSSDMILIAGEHADIWTASLNRGLTHIDGRTITIQKQDPTWMNTSGFRARDGSLWLGGPVGIRHFVNGQLLKVRVPPDLPNNWVVAIADGGPGVIWAAFARSGVFRLSQGVWRKFDQQLGLPEDVPTNIFTDSEGRVWLGYLRGRLARFDGKRFRVFTVADGLNVGDVMTVYERGPHLWIGGEFGLQLYEEGRFRKLNSDDEARFRGVSGIVEAADGDLWLNVVGGIVHVSVAEVQRSLSDNHYRMASREFNYLDGLPGTSAKMRARPTAVMGTDGRIWFSVANGIVWLDPGQLRHNALVPPVHIESITADGSQYLPSTGLRLPQGATDLAIAYTAPSLTTPERVRFRYRLDGSSSWQDPGSRRTAFYTNLAPRHHRFQVIASNNDGVWNETGATTDFDIAPPFYRTYWFLLLCAVAAVCMAWLVYRWRLRQTTARLDMQFQERLSERTRIAQELHDTLLQGVLSASMQLSVASDQLDANSPAKPIVARVLQLLRREVEEGRNAVRGLRLSKDEAEDLVQALSRVPQEIVPQQPVDFRVIVEGERRGLRPMIRDELYRIGREALVNALRHSGASSIEVELGYESRQLRVVVRDNGCGIESPVLRSGREGHWGLSGMRERAERIGGNLRLWSSAGGGTELELTLPGPVAFESSASPNASKWLARFSRRRDDAREAGRRAS